TSRHVHLLYANRDRESTIFAAELDRLVERYPDRLDVAHHLDVERGFIEAGTVRPLAAIAADASYFICGPPPFMDIVEGTLLDHGLEEGWVLTCQSVPTTASGHVVYEEG